MVSRERGGSFDAPQLVLTGSTPTDAIAADVDGDGWPDVVTVGWAYG